MIMSAQDARGPEEKRLGSKPIKSTSVSASSLIRDIDDVELFVRYSGALLAYALLPVLRRVTRTLIPSIETLMPSV
jgi:hypothetical protein